MEYVVNVKDQSKVFHVNLLKRYYSRIYEAVQKRDNSEEGGAVLKLVSSAVMAADGEGGLDDAVDYDELLDMSPCLEREIINDVKLGEELNVEQCAQEQRLIEEFSPVFTDVPGDTDLITHRVKLTLDEPILSRPYPFTYSVRETLRKELSDMLKMNIIQESRFPYSSPIVIVKKRDGTNRLWVNFRKLNMITEADPEPTNSCGDNPEP